MTCCLRNEIHLGHLTPTPVPDTFPCNKTLQIEARRGFFGPEGSKVRLRTRHLAVGTSA